MYEHKINYSEEEAKIEMLFWDTIIKIMKSKKDIKKIDCHALYAKVKQDYKEKCVKQKLCWAEWDKFVNEPIDYRNIHFVLNKPKKEQAKKLIKSYGKI